MNHQRICLYLLVLGLTGTAACNLEKEIDLELPAYESRLVVECYLEPEKPYRLLLTRSAGFFDPFPAFGSDFLDELFVDDARVTITHRGETIELTNTPLLDRETGKVYNYRSPAIVPVDYEAPFTLEIITAGGDTLRATTTLLPPVPIDSIVVEFQAADTLARALTYLTDPPGTNNYYRRVLHKGNLAEDPEQDFASDDRIVEDILVYGTGFDYAEGDTLINTIYHIEEPYYLFLETLNRAASSNGNPFAQPSPLLSNISGAADAIGIFTGLTYDRRQTVIVR